MATEAVLVCKFCRRIFFRSVNRLIYHAVGRCYCNTSCYLNDLEKPIGVRFGKPPEDCILEQCDKALARAIVKRAYKDNDRSFLYSEEGQELIHWAFSVGIDTTPSI